MGVGFEEHFKKVKVTAYGQPLHVFGVRGTFCKKFPSRPLKNIAFLNALRA